MIRNGKQYAVVISKSNDTSLSCKTCPCYNPAGDGYPARCAEGTKPPCREVAKQRGIFMGRVTFMKVNNHE